MPRQFCWCKLLLGECVKVVTLWKGWQTVTFNNLGSSWVADWLNHRPWCVNPGSLHFLDHVPQDSAISKTPQNCFIFITRDDMWITDIHCEDRAGMSQELQEQTAILGQIPDLYLDFWSAEKNDMQFLLKSSPFPFLKSMYCNCLVFHLKLTRSEQSSRVKESILKVFFSTLRLVETTDIPGCFEKSSSPRHGKVIRGTCQ